MTESSTGEAEKVEEQDVNAAESSTAEQGGSMLDAVLSAIEPKDKEPSPSSAPVSEGNTGAQSTEKAADPDPDLSEEDIKGLRYQTKKYIHKLTEQRKDLEASVSALRPKAEQYDQFVSHIRQTGLNSADLDNTFEIATLIKKGDLFAARDKLMPVVKAILEATGGVLPPDLEGEVKAGQLSVQRAQELAEARSRNVLNTHQNGVRQQADAQESASQFLDGVVNAVNDWEAVKRRSDPDWGLKATEIRTGLELAILKGAQPMTVQEAVKMAEDELARVETKFKQFRPQLKPVRSISGTPQASTAAGAPKSLQDAVLQSFRT